MPAPTTTTSQLSGRSVVAARHACVERLCLPWRSCGCGLTSVAWLTALSGTRAHSCDPCARLVPIRHREPGVWPATNNLVCARSASPAIPTTRCCYLDLQSVRLRLHFGRGAHVHDDTWHVHRLHKLAGVSACKAIAEARLRESCDSTKAGRAHQWAAGCLVCARG